MRRTAVSTAAALTLAADAGAVIVGGCCGTSPVHLAAMRRALDVRVPGERPTVRLITDEIGPLVNAEPGEPVAARPRRRRDG